MQRSPPRMDKLVVIIEATQINCIRTRIEDLFRKSAVKKRRKKGCKHFLQEDFDVE